VIEYHAPPGYAETLASRRAFAGMVWDDARQAANTITRDIWCYAVEDPRVASSQRQRAANVACGSDVQSWHDRSAVSNAFAIASDAFTPEACRLVASRRKAAPRSSA
jgi:hypothetical protein